MTVVCEAARPHQAPFRGRDVALDGSSIADVASANMHWYVAHTKVRQEQKARENLDRQGYVTYLPRIKVMKRRRGCQQIQFEPMFPHYVFLRPGSAVHSIAAVRSTLGVKALVRFGQDPAVIRAETLERVRDFETRQNEAPEEDVSPFQPGELIHVVDGPLTGLEGLISSVCHERVVVLMNLLGRDTRVTLSHHQLRVADR